MAQVTADAKWTMSLACRPSIWRSLARPEVTTRDVHRVDAMWLAKRGLVIWHVALWLAEDVMPDPIAS